MPKDNLYGIAPQVMGETPWPSHLKRKLLIGYGWAVPKFLVGV